ncbi:MAG: DUF4097 family beta strand repeat-containing protein [Planctomycetota bacterium]|nr:DUF4097 family beta strand repeat-containing protein [Planctomycetota bacterium]
MLLGLLGGCVGTPTSGLERMENAFVAGEMAIDDPPVMIDTRGSVDLEVVSFGGSIRIEAVEGMEGTTIEPVRRSFHGHLRRDEAETALDEIGYRIELVAGELDREVIVITTSTENGEPHFQGVDFFIRTGRLETVDIDTRRGRVWIKNNRGSVDVSTTYGDVRVVTDHPMTESITLVTKEASIDYRVGPGSTGFYDARSVGGRVYQRFTEARVTATSPENGPSVFIGDVGGGTNPVTLRTTYGDIRVSIVENPTDVGPIIVE